MTDNSVSVEGRLRALEAVLSQMPEFTDDVFVAAKRLLQENWKNDHGPTSNLKAMLAATQRHDFQYDDEAEGALGKLGERRPKKKSDG